MPYDAGHGDWFYRRRFPGRVDRRGVGTRGFSALKALGEIGPDARGAAEAVLAVTHDPSPAIAKLATETLASILQ